MTSSYNISRRPINDKPYNWGAYFRQEGICPMGYITVPLYNEQCGTDCKGGKQYVESAWKYCVPTNTDSYIPKDKKKEMKSCVQANECNKIPLYPDGYTLYQMRGERDAQNRNPMFINSLELLQKSYYNIPKVFNGTGLDTNDYYFATYNPCCYVDKSCKWDRTKLIQDYIDIEK